MKHKHIIVLLAVIILPVFFALNSTHFYSHVRNFSINTFQPLFEASNFLFYNLSDGVSRIFDAIQQYRSYEHLGREIIQLKQKIIDYDEIKSENERLIELLHFKKTVPVEHVVAQVIGHDVSPWSNWIVINIGTQDEAVKDMPIIAQGGLVGKIVFVSLTTSRCILIIDHQSKVSGIIQRSRDTGIIEGNGNGLLTMRYLDLNTNAQVGDVVITSGLGGIYAKGIPIGSITIVGVEDNGLHVFAKIKPFVDFSKLEDVLCLKKSS
ncbi:MAG: rod shape-determining protein MreC [Candidatus Omnitrophica bacterium]|nr:rod shape-determining protein MreC [Candidatus Omnitrophota bacterium]